MATRGTVSEKSTERHDEQTTRQRKSGEETRRYLVSCDGCSLEEPVDGRDGALELGTDHRQMTGHDVVVLEWPS